MRNVIQTQTSVGTLADINVFFGEHRLAALFNERALTSVKDGITVNLDTITKDVEEICKVAFINDNYTNYSGMIIAYENPERAVIFIKNEDKPIGCRDRIIGCDSELLLPLRRYFRQLGIFDTLPIEIQLMWCVARADLPSDPAPAAATRENTTMPSQP